MAKLQGRLTTVAASMIAVLAAGCGSDSDGDAVSEEAKALSCAFDFNATVRHGDDAGLELKGTLMLAALSGGDVHGTLFTKDGPIDVDGSLQDGLAMTFVLDDGREISGTTDPELTSLDTCPESVEGPFTGPSAGDEGDWIADVVVRGGNGSTYTSSFGSNGRVTRILVTAADGSQTTLCPNSVGQFVATGGDNNCAGNT